MCRAWVVAGVMPVVVPLAHDVATSWALSLVLGPSFRAGGVVVISVGIVRRDNMARPQLYSYIIIIYWNDWNPLDSTGLGLDSEKWLAVQWESSGLDWTGLDWTPVDWAFCQPIWPGKRATGIHWSPLESTGVHMDYVGEGKDLHSGGQIFLRNDVIPD
ncbi:uncharacterized protein LACBIDRAFT_336060 [Laccaria bicolor S238N-H82]|uniref:Predicted protein n=1 Tax=Laccaria bicolor (strain S238N-H82 / ATCC MYA-4686) TaxID=486041 RepID=B0E499_LACBS|nr:uncharacterized protein LACBIDRAFT_336060 [Laccaria bicolor S238N-H82]EDQ98330.1 predicted protein [Laccaria bicolor S238N-H82]|eukprot:XP_001891017.1 predicted protein [Laccaria bicolor S238N-H82]